MSEPWSTKFGRYRRAKGWSLTDAARAFIAVSDLHTSDQIDSVRRTISRWEQGGIDVPSPENQAAIATMFDLPVKAFFPDTAAPAPINPGRLSVDTWTDLMAQLGRTSVDIAVLDTAEAEVERLCTAYAGEPVGVVLEDSEQLGRYLVGLQSQLDLRSMTRTYEMLAKLSLLRACLLYDLDDRSGAEAARRSAFRFAQELGDGPLLAWSYEITSWVALTTGDLPQVIASADAGTRCAPQASVAAQLHAQSAKAWARMHDRHKTELALDRVRTVLDAQPPAANLRNHFVVDPTKANFYAMDAYRVIGADDLAEAMADTVVLTSTTPDGRILSPMRLAEAKLTHATLRARQGDVGGAVAQVEQALAIGRRSAPSLAMVAREVTAEIARIDPGTAEEFNRDTLSNLSTAGTR